MSFATPENVAGFFRNFDPSAGNSAVTSVEIQEWLDTEHSFVLGKIYTMYKAPITVADNPLSANIIKDIEAMLVAGRVDDILNTYTEAQKKPMWEKRAMYRLEEYVPKKDKDGKQPTPTILLPDAEFLGSTSQQGQLKLSSTSTPIFTKGQDNW